MSPSRPSRAFSTMMALGLALGTSAAVHAQSSISQGGGNLSTGSGSGTSPGVNAGSSPSSTNTNTTRPGLPGLIPRGGTGDLVPGAGPSSSGGRSDAFILPGGDLPAALNPAMAIPLSAEEIRTLDARLLPDARTVTDPSQRSLALERVAREKILKHVVGDRNLEDAHDALREAARAVSQVNDPIVRDLRIMAIIRNALTLADEFTRLGTNDETYILEPDFTSPDLPDLDPEISKPPIAKKTTLRDRVNLLIRAEQERAFASEIALRLESSNFQAEMLFRVVENEAQASQKVAGEVLKIVDPRDYPARLDPQGRELFDTRGKKVTTPTGRYDLEGSEKVLGRMADRSMVFAANDAAKIRKFVWRDRSMVTITVAAANSDQFDRALEVARLIPAPEYRSDALIRLAESEARRGRAAEATRTYTEAAKAVASIALDDPRDILASVLIDSLISVGRFDDARACIPFYRSEQRQVNALGTVAESQGERRLDQAALAWINHDAPLQFRETLRRRVVDGMIKALNRSSKDELPAGEPKPGPAPGGGASTSMQRGGTSPKTGTSGRP